MSNKKRPTAQVVLRRVTLGLYIAAVIVSLAVVVSYIVWRWIDSHPPEHKDPQVEFPLVTDSPPEQSAGGTSDPTATDPPKTLILNRREGVYTCLLLGVADQGGSDTIMLGVFDTNKESKSATLISIPRDTVVRYNGEYIKLNASYSYGGVEAVRRCVTETLAVPIDYYVTVDTRAFQRIVDVIGGVWFNVPPGMDYDDPTQNLHIHLTPGYQKLNGADALKLVRCRSAYASQDLGRAATQRAFLAALVKQTVTLSNVIDIGKVTSLINILNTYVKTDMSRYDMVAFGEKAVGMDPDTDLTSAVLSENWVSPYIVPTEEEVLKLVNSLRIYQEEVPAEVLRLAHP